MEAKELRRIAEMFPPPSSETIGTLSEWPEVQGRVTFTGERTAYIARLLNALPALADRLEGMEAENARLKRALELAAGHLAKVDDLEPCEGVMVSEYLCINSEKCPDNTTQCWAENLLWWAEGEGE